MTQLQSELLLKIVFSSCYYLLMSYPFVFCLSIKSYTLFSKIISNVLKMQFEILLQLFLCPNDEPAFYNTWSEIMGPANEKNFMYTARVKKMDEKFK